MLLLFRSLATGLMGGCLLLLVGFEPRTVIIMQPAPPPAVHMPAGATLIDVAETVSPVALSSLVRLDRGEHVTTVDDVRVDNDLAAGSTIAARGIGRRSFIDLGIDGPAGPRRVLLLLH